MNACKKPIQCIFMFLYDVYKTLRKKRKVTGYKIIDGNQPKSSAKLG